MKIICIGRNYADHIGELSGLLAKNAGRSPEGPVFFMKPDTALLRNNSPFYIPDFSREIHYETELVLHVCRVGRSVSPRFASRYYDSVGLGIDFTARDLQRRAAAEGLPWEPAKAFDFSAAVSPRFVPLSELGGDVGKLRFEMRLNGELRQSGDTSMMLWSPDEIICHVSRFVTLRMGDLIFTGTPSGVGPVKAGDRLEARLESVPMLDFEIR